MKKCILVDGAVCNNCGECMRCDIDPNKLCDNCGKCLKLESDDEFRSVIVHKDDADDDMSEEEKKEQELLNAFLDLPIDLRLPEPIEVDPALAAEWEEKLKDLETCAETAAEDGEEPSREISIHGKRKRKPRLLH